LVAIVQRDLANRTAQRSAERHQNNAIIKPPHAFHDDPRYGGDLHRADLAWTIYAASRGVPAQQISDEILYARDLSKKGPLARQLDYAECTALKAFTIVQTLIVEFRRRTSGARPVARRWARERILSGAPHRSTASHPETVTHPHLHHPPASFPRPRIRL
ncbi:MAG TPA: hypothetical protein VKS22_04130, partial [Candidatus Binataceae bacterium]|nr:hypothetical protein [Candidatus Binataceae bacterium]